MAENATSDPCLLPVLLTRRLTPLCFSFSVKNLSKRSGYNLTELLQAFILGESCELMDLLSVHMEYGGTPWAVVT